MTPNHTLYHRPPPSPMEAERRLRDSGGPQDLASYRCACRLLFKAPVTTTVQCPRCGTSQSW